MLNNLFQNMVFIWNQAWKKNLKRRGQSKAMERMMGVGEEADGGALLLEGEGAGAGMWVTLMASFIPCQQ